MDAKLEESYLLMGAHELNAGAFYLTHSLVTIVARSLSW